MNEDEETGKMVSGLPMNKSYFSRDKFSQEVAFILLGMDLQQYIEAFQTHNVSLDRCRELTDNDLILLGVKNPQHRQRILSAMRVRLAGSSREIHHSPIIPYNPMDDRKIISHMLEETRFLEQNLHYLMKNLNQFTPVDYHIAGTHSGLSLAKIVVEKAIQQTELICTGIYNESHDCLIKQLEAQQGYPISNKIKKKRTFMWRNVLLCSAAATALLSVIIFNII